MSTQFRVLYLRLAAVMLGGSILGCDSAPQPRVEKTCESAPTEKTLDVPADRWKSLGLDGPQISDITSIAINPCDPEVLLVGSGFSFSGGKPGQLFRSPDGGETWDTVAVAGASFQDVQFVSSNPEIAFSATGDVLKSTDGGASWNVVTEEMRFTRIQRPLTLAIAPDRPKIVYAGVGGFSAEGGVMKSTEGGENWSWLEGFEDRNTVSTVAISPRDSEVVYAGVSETILKSTDGGASWRSIFSESGIIVSIVFASQTGAHLYVSARSSGIFESRDGGRTWRRPRALPDSVELVLDLAVSPARGELYAATTEGVYRKRGTEEWEPMNEGFSHTRVQSLAISPAEERIYAGLDWTSPEGVGMYARKLTR